MSCVRPVSRWLVFKQRRSLLWRSAATVWTPWRRLWWVLYDVYTKLLTACGNVVKFPPFSLWQRSLRDTFQKYPGPEELSQCVTWDVMQSTLLSERENLQKVRSRNALFRQMFGGDPGDASCVMAKSEISLQIDSFWKTSCVWASKSTTWLGSSSWCKVQTSVLV